MASPRILVQYASRSRPQRFFEGLRNIFQLAADKTNIVVHCCLDADDGSMFRRSDDPAQIVEALPFVKTEMDLHAVDPEMLIDYDIGYSKSKVDAINRPLPSIPWDILVNFSDDMRFIVFGWDEIIREGFRCNGDDLFLHYPDNDAKQMLSTMSIMDRKYYDRDGWIYHPGFKSLWADNFAMDLAQRRGRYRYLGIQIFYHYHPAYGHVPYDEQYSRQQAFWDEDEAFYKYLKTQPIFTDAIIDIDTDGVGTRGTI